MPDNTTLAGFLEKIEQQYGRSDRVWNLDRGIPTEEVLQTMRQGASPVRYLVGTPKGRLTALEQSFLEKLWKEVRQHVEVKLLDRDGEVYVLVRSEHRVSKERSMRRRRLKQYWRRLHELQRQTTGTCSSCSGQSGVGNGGRPSSLRNALCFIVDS